ncbi:hypothetical protein Sjap_018935 [Stephania japonica]|uniref:Uncharacterized protein n=1 Tax=Stephania japonica TaxID=461633 RepID=A0AAP0EZ23_9MAGN
MADQTGPNDDSGTSDTRYASADDVHILTQRVAMQDQQLQDIPVVGELPCSGLIGDDFQWFIGVPTVPNHPSPRGKRARYGPHIAALLAGLSLVGVVGDHANLGFVFGYGREWWFYDLARVSPASLCRGGSFSMSDNTSESS